MRRSKVNLSHSHLTTCEMGKLIPFVAIDCLPGDIFKISAKSIHKAQPLVAPLMHQIDIILQYYFVPYRLLWENWVPFITGGESGQETPTYPTIIFNNAGINTLADYFGVPTDQNNIEFSAMPFRAYTKIWNDHYKIDDIENEKVFGLGDGVDTETPTTLNDCHWARDRFTRAKPFTQRGNQIAVPVQPSLTDQQNVIAEYEPIISFIGNPTITEPTDLTKIGTIQAGSKVPLRVWDTTPYVIHYNSNNQTQPTTINNATTITLTASINHANITNETTTGYLEFVIYYGTNTYGTATTGANSSTMGITYTSDNTVGLSPIVKQTIYQQISINWGLPKSYPTSTSFNGNLSIDAQEFANSSTNYYTQTNILSGTRSWALNATSGNNINLGNIFKISNVRIGINSTVSTTGSLNIRDLRIASALQRFNEKSLKYGAEYEDYCQQEFKVRPRDSRLQKSEYLGGSKSILQISEVFQTTDTADTPLGAQAGYGIGSLKQRRIKYFCPEHGIIIGLLSYRPVTIYSQGIDRAWLKRDRFDYFTREFVDIGAQEIKTQEIFATADNKDEIFGYDLTGNYREYHSQRNRISGNFKTDLNFWTLSRNFATQPYLNSSFLAMNPRKDIFAITDETLPAFLTFMQNQIIAYRPIPKRSRNLLK